MFWGSEMQKEHITRICLGRKFWEFCKCCGSVVFFCFFFDSIKNYYKMLVNDE